MCNMATKNQKRMNLAVKFLERVFHLAYLKNFLQLVSRFGIDTQLSDDVVMSIKNDSDIPNSIKNLLVNKNQNSNRSIDSKKNDIQNFVTETSQWERVMTSQTGDNNAKNIANYEKIRGDIFRSSQQTDAVMTIAEAILRILFTELARTTKGKGQANNTKRESSETNQEPIAKWSKSFITSDNKNTKRSNLHTTSNQAGETQPIKALEELLAHTTRDENGNIMFVSMEDAFKALYPNLTETNTTNKIPLSDIMRITLQTKEASDEGNTKKRKREKEEGGKDEEEVKERKKKSGRQDKLKSSEPKTTVITKMKSGDKMSKRENVSHLSRVKCYKKNSDQKYFSPPQEQTVIVVDDITITSDIKSNSTLLLPFNQSLSNMILNVTNICDKQKSQTFGKMEMLEIITKAFERMWETKREEVDVEMEDERKPPSVYDASPLFEAVTSSANEVTVVDTNLYELQVAAAKMHRHARSTGVSDKVKNALSVIKSNDDIKKDNETLQKLVNELGGKIMLYYFNDKKELKTKAIRAIKRNKQQNTAMYLVRHIHYTNGAEPEQLKGYTPLKPKSPLEPK